MSWVEVGAWFSNNLYPKHIITVYLVQIYM